MKSLYFVILPRKIKAIPSSHLNYYFTVKTSPISNNFKMAKSLQDKEHHQFFTKSLFFKTWQTWLNNQTGILFLAKVKDSSHLKLLVTVNQLITEFVGWIFEATRSPFLFGHYYLKMKDIFRKLSNWSSVIELGYLFPFPIYT